MAVTSELKDGRDWEGGPGVSVDAAGPSLTGAIDRVGRCERLQSLLVRLVPASWPHPSLGLQ